MLRNNPELERKLRRDPRNPYSVDGVTIITEERWRSLRYHYMWEIQDVLDLPYHEISFWDLWDRASRGASEPVVLFQYNDRGWAAIEDRTYAACAKLRYYRP